MTIPGNFEDERIAVLFNPYHDKLGKFTFKRGGVTPGALGADVSINTGKGELTASGISEGEAKILSKEHESVSKGLSKMYGEGFDDVDVVVAETPGNSQAAHYNIQTGKIVVQPYAAKYITNRRTRDTGRLILIHERIHSRHGNRGRVSIDKLSGKSKEQQWDMVNREEALTSLLAERYQLKAYGRSDRYYSKYTNVVANYFLKEAGGDREKAWRMIDDAHAKGFDYNVPYSRMASYPDVSSRSYTDLMLSEGLVTDGVLEQYFKARRETWRMIIEEPEKYKMIYEKLDKPNSSKKS